MHPRISVIIPTYNRASRLAQAIESVLAQTFQDFELIVVDDGSADDTLQVVRRFADRVRYIRQPHRGVSAARNTGIRHGRGEWLAFLDSDDRWLPHKLERQMAALEQTGRKICYTDEIWIRNGCRVNPRRRHRKYDGWIFVHCLPLCIISPSSVVIHRRVFETVGLFDETLPACEDYDLWLRITARYPVTFLQEPLIIKYGGHADQLSRRVSALDRYRIRALMRILRDPGLRPEWRRAAVEELIRKTRIYLQGCRKRGNWPEYFTYTSYLIDALRVVASDGRSESPTFTVATISSSFPQGSPGARVLEAATARTFPHWPECPAHPVPASPTRTPRDRRSR